MRRRVLSGPSLFVTNISFLFSLQARYKQSLDPTVDEVKKLCTSLRRNAKEERVLFHYNGHGVPRPTVNGEVWVFNKVG
jgi:regulator-associated protein of mTOR